MNSKLYPFHFQVVMWFFASCYKFRKADLQIPVVSDYFNKLGSICSLVLVPFICLFLSLNVLNLISFAPPVTSFLSFFFILFSSRQNLFHPIQQNLFQTSLPCHAYSESLPLLSSSIFFLSLK